jgi:hypothetical protein
MLVLYSVLLRAYWGNSRNQLRLEPRWQHIKDSCLLFDDRWILVGTIIFGNKGIEPLEIDTLVLCWHGQYLDKLFASLYRTEINEPFLAIDNYWIADGIWDKTKQRIIFKLETKKRLSTITNFHLMLTIPACLEPIIKKGSFSIESHYLPISYQNIAPELLTLRF